VSDAATVIIQSVLDMRAACAVLSGNSFQDNPTLMRYIRQASFQGVTGPVNFVDPRNFPPPNNLYGAGASNDRDETDFFLIVNIVGSTFVTVGNIRNGVIGVTAKIVFPGSQTTPLTQYPFGLLWSNVTGSGTAAAAALPAAMNFALGKLNEQLNQLSPFFSTRGRSVATFLPVHFGVDDCGKTPSKTIAALSQMLTMPMPCDSSSTSTCLKAPTWSLPVAVIGFQCTAALNNTDVVNFIKRWAPNTPFLVFGAIDLDFSSVVTFPNFFRINFPSSLDAQVAASVAQSYGLPRMFILYSDEQVGRSLFSFFSKLVNSYNLRTASILKVDTTVSNSNITTFLSNMASTRSDVRVLMMFLGTMTSGPLTGVNLPQLVAQIYVNNSASLSKIQVIAAGDDMMTYLSNSDAAASLAFQGALATQLRFNLDSVLLKNTTAAFLQAYPWVSDMSLAPFVYDAVFAIATGLRNVFQSNGNPFTDLNSFMRSVNLVGITGNINFTSSNNYRIPPPGIVNLFSFCPSCNTKLQRVGASNTDSDVTLLSNPVAFAGNLTAPIVACGTAYIASITVNSIGIVTRACSPCLKGRFAPLNGLSCVNCSQGVLCPHGSSVSFSPSVAWNQPASTTFPFKTGMWANSSTLAQIYLVFIISGVAGFSFIFGITNLVVATKPQLAKEFLAKFDMFVAEHPTEPGQPVTRRSTIAGGYFTITYFFALALACAYFAFTFQQNKYSVVQTTALGTLSLKNPTLFSVTVVFVSSDNAPNCPSVCSGANITGVTGTFSCRFNQVDATCSAVFLVSEQSRYLPFVFSLSLWYPAAHTHGIQYFISGATVNGVQTGNRDALLANDGPWALFGPTGSSVVQVDVQPYVFYGKSDLPDAPSFNSGYMVIPNSKTLGPQVTLSNYTTVEFFKAGGGVGVVFSFNRLNSVSVYTLSQNQSLIAIASQVGIFLPVVCGVGCLVGGLCVVGNRRYFVCFLCVCVCWCVCWFVCLFVCLYVYLFPVAV
jgi:hypothetical protein